MSWTLVIPFKGSPGSKSRLGAGGVSPDMRQRLAEAFLLDALHAARACQEVSRLIVSTPDGDVAQTVAQTGCEVWVEPAGLGGLNASVSWALNEANQPRTACAVMASDVPFVTSSEISQALQLGAKLERSMVADREGTGTTMLLANHTKPFGPAFGENSRLLHSALGFEPLPIPQASGLRNDVDVFEHLHSPYTLGLGSHTSAVLKTLASHQV